jgi:hypothetical protein
MLHLKQCNLGNSNPAPAGRSDYVLKDDQTETTGIGTYCVADFLSVECNVWSWLSATHCSLSASAEKLRSSR